ncbi:MAG: esterase [Planctomycetes bacterium]|nr:esterase [Planctomycetota bacterium]
MAGWSQVEISGKQADLFRPGGHGPAQAALLFLHGHARITLKDNSVYTNLLEQYSLACVCPHGQRSWWGDRICTDFDDTLTPIAYLVDHVLPWMQAELKLCPPAIALAGVAMGGQGALRLAYRYPDRFPIVVAISPAVDFQIWHGRGLPLDEMYESAEEARQDTATLRLHPMNWPRHQFLLCDPNDAEWFDGAERLASKLYSTGIPFEQDFTTRHGGHSWEYVNHVAPRVFEFITTRLAQEQQQLPTLPAGEPSAAVAPASPHP